MLSFRAELSRRLQGRRWVVLAGLAVLGLLPGTGCQVEYAGMTLPSGKYMHDDVQYFTPGPDFPWANTQAATQRARMAAAGETPPPVVAPPTMSAPAPAAGVSAPKPAPAPAAAPAAAPAPAVAPPPAPAPGIAPVPPPPGGDAPAPAPPPNF